MASAKKLPSGTWRVQVSKVVNGKKIKRSFSANPSDFGGDWRKAKAHAELLARNWTFDAETEKHKKTVKQALDLFMEKKSNVLSASTISDYTYMPKYFEEIWEKDINDIDSKDIQNIINAFAVKKLSSKTIRNRISMLITSLEFAGVEKRFRYTIPKTIKPELPPPEPSEYHRLLSMASPELKLAIILSGLYTLRRGEIGGLCGEDILWDLNSIYIHTSRVKKKFKGSKRVWVRKEIPKNDKSVRVVQIDPEIMKLIPKVGPKEYVIKMKPDTITKRFIDLKKKACVDCRFHDLRKHAASIRSDLKIPSKYIEADGGWRPGSAVLKTIYDKPFKEKRKEYSQKINKQILEEYGNDLFG